MKGSDDTTHKTSSRGLIRWKSVVTNMTSLGGVPSHTAIALPALPVTPWFAFLPVPCAVDLQADRQRIRGTGTVVHGCRCQRDLSHPGAIGMKTQFLNLAHPTVPPFSHSFVPSGGRKNLNPKPYVQTISINSNSVILRCIARATTAIAVNIQCNAQADYESEQLSPQALAGTSLGKFPNRRYLFQQWGNF